MNIEKYFPYDCLKLFTKILVKRLYIYMAHHLYTCKILFYRFIFPLEGNSC